VHGEKKLQAIPPRIVQLPGILGRLFAGFKETAARLTSLRPQVARRADIPTGGALARIDAAVLR
jgi:hypothetical protein